MQGLRTIKGWLHNAQDRPAEWSWEPKFFMTDFCEREIVAIEEVFPGKMIIFYLSVILKHNFKLFRGYNNVLITFLLW